MKHETCPPGETLLAYQDHALDATRRLLIHEHLRVCPQCRARLRGSDELGHLLRAVMPTSNDPAGRATLKAQLRRTSRAPETVPRTRRLLLHPLMAFSVGLVVLAFTIVHADLTRADFRLGRFVAFIHEQDAGDRPSLIHEQLPPGTAVSPGASATGAPDLPNGMVAPTRLPLDLLLVERTVPTADRVQLLYRSAQQLVIRVVEEPSDQSAETTDQERADVFVIEGVEVVVERNALGGIWHIVWERADVLVDVLVVQSSSTGLALADAERLVTALIEASP